MPNSDPNELTVLLHGAGYSPIADRAFLRITGSDATRWLNGMVSNTIQALQPGEGNYNFLLNAQGRIQGDAMVFRESGDAVATFLLETESAQLETIRQHLDHFIIMDDVELTPVEGLSGVLVAGPEALSAVAALGTANHRAAPVPRRTSSTDADRHAEANGLRRRARVADPGLEPSGSAF